MRRMMVLGAAVLLVRCMGRARVSKDLVDLARQTKTGGEFVIEVDETGKVINADAQVDISRVPKSVMEVADPKLWQREDNG